MDNKYEKVFKVFRKHYDGVPLEVFEDPFEILISTMMSSRTNDDTTLPVAKSLFKKAPEPRNIVKLSVKEIEKLIYPVGFYKTKAKRIKEIAQKLIDDFDGKVPDTREELIKLPGVGIKTANLVLVRAFDKQAISVDTHVHRITNMLGWVDTKTPEKTELQLIKVLPKKYWKEINKFFVSIGRQYRSKKQMRGFLEKNKLI